MCEIRRKYLPLTYMEFTIIQIALHVTFVAPDNTDVKTLPVLEIAKYVKMSQ
jgi:hypothetical protein